VPELRPGSVTALAPARQEPAPEVRADPIAPMPPITVEVTHTTLEHARYHPVLVGHTMGGTLDGAERHLDVRWRGRLSRRIQHREYPQRLGDSLFLHAPKEGTHPLAPSSACIIGLGPVGELTRTDLTDAVAAALFELGLALSEDAAPDDTVLMPVSTVLCGTSGPMGLPIDAAVVAMVDGALHASRRLAQLGTSSGSGAAVRITALEIVERYEDRAEHAAHVVRSISAMHRTAAGGGAVLDPASTLRRGSGGLPRRSAGDDRRVTWQRVLLAGTAAHSDDPPTPSGMIADIVIDVTPVGARARADRMRVPVDASVVDALIDQAIGSADAGSGVAGTLFELLVPQPIKAELASSDNLHLLVDAVTANYPWEMLAPRGTELDEPRHTRGRLGVLRQFRESEGAASERRAPTGRTMLVIGNPPAGAAHDDLAHASAEAKSVAQAFSQASYDVTALVWDRGEPVGVEGAASTVAAGASSATAVMNALFAQDWRVVHIAAHGKLDADPMSSGAVIGEDTFVTASVIDQLPCVPDLVFLNCCHLGTIGANRLAAGVARGLMRIGVRAVVVAGWQVEERGAAAFAEHLYARLLSGASFGDAVVAAREAALSASPTTTTWAAYQCYGDPGFHLELADSEARLPLPPIDAQELLRRIGALHALASDVGRADRSGLAATHARLATELERCEADAEREGWQSSDVLSASAGVWAQLGRLEQAVERWSAALVVDDAAELPARTPLDCANAEMRVAQRMHQEGRDAAAVETLTDSAMRRVKRARLVGLARSTEAALGSLLKKRATMVDGDARMTLVRRSITAYARAATAASSDEQARWYPEIVGAHLRLLADPGAEVQLPDAKRIKDTIGGFYGSIGEADALLALALRDRAVVNDRDALTKRYMDAFRTQSSWLDRRSVIDHLCDLATLHPLPDQADALRTIAGELASFDGTELGASASEGEVRDEGAQRR
jgi:hypothetical protein